MKKASYDYFDHYRYDGEYAVRQYDKYGNGQAVVYCDTLEEAEHQRTWHAHLIGLEPEPTYKDFALYPTIWHWDDTRYERMLGY